MMSDCIKMWKQSGLVRWTCTPTHPWPRGHAPPPSGGSHFFTESIDQIKILHIVALKSRETIKISLSQEFSFTQKVFKKEHVTHNVFVGLFLSTTQKYQMHFYHIHWALNSENEGFSHVFIIDSVSQQQHEMSQANCLSYQWSWSSLNRVLWNDCWLETGWLEFN